MTDTSYTSGGDDDMPRTVRQQKEARARDQMAREILGTPRSSPSGARASASSSFVGQGDAGRRSDFATSQSPPGEVPPATVTRLELPFLHLAGFFLKAVLAAIPALLLLTAILWGGGQLAKTYFPSLVQMKIDITFPQKTR